MKYVAKNLRLLRHFNKMNKFFSQKDISEISKIPQTHISRIESLQENVRIYDLMFYSKFFDVSADDILFKEYHPETKKFVTCQNIQYWIFCSKFIDEYFIARSELTSQYNGWRGRNVSHGTVLANARTNAFGVPAFQSASVMNQERRQSTHLLI